MCVVARGAWSTNIGVAAAGNTTSGRQWVSRFGVRPLGHWLLKYHARVRLRLLGTASIIVLLSACGSDAAGTRPSIAATFEPVGSLETPVGTDVGALPPATPPVEQPPAETARVEPTAPAVVTDTPTTAPTVTEVPSDEGNGATWWPWVVGAIIVVVGAFVVLARRRPSGPSWPNRTTSLLDEIEQLTSHLVALTPDGLHAVAAQDAMRLATLRATLGELIESAPDAASRTVLAGLNAPMAELHGAVDALALSAEPSSTPAGPAVPSLAAQLHTVSTSVRAQLALHRG
jgi:hypothetical protein